MKSPLDAIEAGLAAQEKPSMGATTLGQMAYVIDPTDPAMAATLRIIEELNLRRGEAALLRFMFLGCPEHPDYRPLDWEGNLKPSPHTECKLCGAILEAATYYRATFMREPEEVKEDGSVQSNGNAGSGV